MAPHTPGLVRRAPCLECQRTFEQPARACQPRYTCSPACHQLRVRRQKRDSKRRRAARLRVEWLRRIPVEGRGPHFTLDPGELADLLEARARGWSTTALAIRYDVSTRTVQRALRLGRPDQVTVGRYSAWFAPQQEGPPVQLTSWRRDWSLRE